MSIEENGSRVESSREDHTGTSTFDSAARGLADGSVSRGKALRMLAASLFGGALVAAPAGMALAAPRDNRKPGGTGCPKAGQIRNNHGECVCQSQLITCGPTNNESCVDPNTCGGGQRVNTTTCKCECINSNETLCPGTGQCVSNACPEGAFLETSGQSCECQCRNNLQEINTVTKKCECTNTCDTAPPPVGKGEVRNDETCACECPPNFLRCGGNCVAECLEGFVLKNCECVAEVTCLDICVEGCCDQGTCRGGDLDTACGAAGEACEDCTAAGNVCVNGDCVECATNAQCAAGQACVDNVCGACTTDAQCGTGQVCSSGVCVQCVTNAQCAAGQACVNNVCGACTTDAQCGTGQVCSSGVCVTAPTTGTCTTNADCTTQSQPICVSGQCAACTTNAQCGGTQVCCTTGTKAGQCKNNTNACS
jgi:Cys-rich repeat protein